MNKYAFVVLVGVLAGFASETSAQEEPEARNTQMGFALEESLRLEEGRFKVDFPPRKDSLLGAVVAFKAGGELEVLSRLPEKSLSQNIERRGGRVESDLLVSADTAVLSKLLSFSSKPEESVRLFWEANNVEQVTAISTREDGFAEALSGMEPFFASNRERTLYLVSSVCRGQVRATLSWPDSQEPPATSKLDYFVLSRPRHGESTLALTSTLPVEFGYRLELLTYSPTGPANTRIKRVPKKADEIPRTLWESIQPLYGAADDFHRVRVFYATDRKDMRAASQPEPPKPQFRQHFIDFWMLNGMWLGIAAATAIASIFVLGKFVGPRRRWIRFVPFVLAVAIAPLLAWKYAAQESAKDADGQGAGLTVDRGELTYGTCEVSIPKNHKSGELEKPFAMFLIEFRPENPVDDVVLLERSQPIDWKSFVGEIQERLDESPKRETFVFIHGYNNSFAEAAKRTAQFWYDLRFEGPPILYSWPSQGTVSQYATDENEVARSESYFKTFLRDLVRDSKAKRVHLIAHSMGNRILANTLVTLAEDGTLDRADCQIREVILAAPDIDAEVFQKELAPKFVKRKPRVTLYASSNDEALKTSRNVMVNKYRRAGDADGGIVVVDGLESIDASQLNTSLDTHGYFAAYLSVITDIREVLVNGLPARERRLDEKKQGNLSYFLIPR